MDSFIKAISYYLPKKVLTNQDITKKFPEWTEEKIFEKVGIKERHIAAENETALDMAEKAANKLFTENEDLKEKIDFIIFCTQSPDYKLPTSACILQDRLGIKQSAGAFDFNLGCSGYVYGLSIAKAYVSSGLARNVLLLTSETYSKYLHPEDKSNISIFGDAASATVVSTDGFLKIGEFVFGTDGSGYNQLIVKDGASRNPKNENNVTEDENGHVVSSSHLFMDGQSIFSFTLKQVPKLVDELLAKNKFEKANIDLFVLHQANVFILEFLRKKLKIEKEKFYYCIENVGNTVSNSIPIALLNANDNGGLNNNKNILLAGFGVGLSWAGCILEKQN